MNRNLQDALAALLILLHVGAFLAIAPDQLRAQESGASPSSARATAEAQESLRWLESAHREAIQAWQADQRRAVEQAIADGKPIPAMRMAPPAELTNRHLEILEEEAASFNARGADLPFRLRVLELADPAKNKVLVKRQIDAVFGRHLKSRALVAVPAIISRRASALGDSLVDEVMTRLLLESPHLSVRAECLGRPLLQVLAKEAPGTMSFDRAKKTVSMILARAQADLPEALDRDFRAIIARREGAVTGTSAPDIQGVDLDGVAFKLSDYRGKVILLDFWGDW